MVLLKEMQVIDAVCAFLTTRHFRVISRVQTVYQHGTDIVAESPRTHPRLAIEAKGQTTSRKTRRIGKEFTANQKEDHLGRALVKSLQAITAGQAAATALQAG